MTLTPIIKAYFLWIFFIELFQKINIIFENKLNQMQFDIKRKKNHIPLVMKVCRCLPILYIYISNHEFYHLSLGYVKS